MLEAAIALAMADHIAGIADTDRQGGRGPQFIGLIVAYIDDFPWRVAYRVVRPGCQLVFAAVATPSATASQLRHHEAEARIGDDIDPGGRCPLPLVEHDHIFAPVFGKPSQPVEEFKRG